MWTRMVPAIRDSGLSPRQLWDRDTGSRWTRARSPNAGEYWTIPLDGGLPAPETNRGFRYRDGDLNGVAWRNVSQMELVVFASWTSSRHYIDQLSTAPGARNLNVTFTSPCGFSPTGMWPNSGNRYYAENDVTMVDADGEWHIDPATGMLTVFSAEDPSDLNLVLDRGGAVLDGVLVKSEAPAMTTLVGAGFWANSGNIKVLPASLVAWGASSFVLSAVVKTSSAAAGQTIFFKGPATHVHVANDKSLYLDAGCKLALDIGWVGHLGGGPMRRGPAAHRRQLRLRGTKSVCDGLPHTVELRFDQPTSTYTLVVDGVFDVASSFGAADESPAGWQVEVGRGWSTAGGVSNVTYAFFTPERIAHLHFVGLEVAHVGWDLQTGDITDFQAVSYLASAAVHLATAANCSARELTVRHVGGMGVWIEGGSTGVDILDSYVTDVGAGGIRVGRGQPLANEPPGNRTSDVTVNNSRIVNGSQVYQAGNGVLLQNSPRFTLTNSEVAYFNHVGVTLGWVWGFTMPPATHDNTVERNHVHHVGNGVLSDLGGIYALGAQPGTKIRFNVVHDSNPYFMYGHGVYFDEGASGILLERNWVHSAFSALFMQHYGVNNTVQDNVFARTTGRCLSFATTAAGEQVLCAGHLWDPAYRGQQCGYTFRRNIVWMDGTQGYVHAGAEGRCNGSFAANVYYNASGPVTSTFPGSNTATFPGYPGARLNFRWVNASFAQWRASGQDGGSIVADPKFVAGPDPVGARDFRLRPDSPALALGFQQTDLRTGVGPDWTIA